MSVVMDVLNGIGNGFASLVGFGSDFDKMGDASAQLKKIQQDTNTLTSINSLAFATDVNTGMETLRELISLTGNQTQVMQQNTDQFINDSLQKENLFILFLYLLLFILIYFFLFQKKCC